MQQTGPGPPSGRRPRAWPPVPRSPRSRATPTDLLKAKQRVWEEREKEKEQREETVTRLPSRVIRDSQIPDR